MPRQTKLFFDFKSALAHLQGENKLSASAVSALSGANRQDVASFAQTWITLPAARRRQATQMLIDLSENNIELDFNALFRYLLNDEDPPVRAMAIDGLWEDEDLALVKPFIGFMRSDPDARVRAAAADSLGRFMLLGEYGRLPQSPYGDLIYEALLATIHGTSEELDVRCRAVEAISYCSRERVRDIIASAYADEDDQMRASAVAAMGRSADSYWRKTAARELDSPNPRMRFEAARTAGELEDRSAVARLIELLDDPDREVQMVTITALGQIGGRDAREALTRAAASDDDALRDLADDALQEMRFSSDPNFLLFDIDLDEEDFADEDDVADETG